MIRLLFVKKTKKFLPLLLLCLISCCFTSVKASKSDSLRYGLRVETKIHYGFIYPHHSAIEYLLAGNISGAEVSLSHQTDGSMPWEVLFRYPRYGIGYNFNNFANPQVLGYSHAMFGFFDASIYRSRRIFSLNYQFDFGFAYINKNYQPYTNPMNIAISAHTNVYIGIDFDARWKIGKRNELKTALELSHFSNGKIRSPNLGLNTVTLSAAWLYSLSPDRNLKLFPPAFGFKRHFVEIVWSGGAKRDDMLDEKIYKISTLVMDYNYAISAKYAFGCGLDFFFDESLRPTKEYEEGIASEKGDNLQLGAHVGARTRYGRMNIIMDVGHYVYADFYKYSGMYSRIGMRYMATDYLMLTLSIKAHYAIADYIEWGVGYRFKTRGL